MLKHDPKPIESLRGLSAVLFVKRTSLMLVGTLPLIVGGLMDALGLSASQAGLLTTIELCFAVLTGTLTSLYLARLPRYQITVAAIIVVALAYTMAAPMESFTVFVISRVIGGCAEGVIAATTTSAIATAKNPDRVTALIMTIGSVSGFLFFALVSWAHVGWGISGVYAVLSLYCWAMLLVIRWLPVPAPEKQADRDGKVKLQGAALAVPVLLGYVLWLVGESSLWAFIERMGKGIGLSAAQIAVVLSIQSIASLCGSGAAALLGLRLGRTAPLAACIGLVGVIIAVLPHTTTLAGYSVSITAWTFLLGVSVPYIFGILARLDAQGRWLGLQAVALPLGTAIGPYLGGLAIESVGYVVLGRWVALSYLIIFLLMIPVSIKVSAAAPKKPPSLPQDEPVAVKP